MNNGLLPQTNGAPPTTHPVLLEVERVAEMRAVLHELANVFTGVLITGGLLTQKLDGLSEASFAQSVCDLGERGSELVRRARALLLGCGLKDEDFGRERGMINVGR